MQCAGEMFGGFEWFATANGDVYFKFELFALACVLSALTCGGHVLAI